MQHFAEPRNRSPWRDAFCRIWPSAATARRSSRCSTTCPAKSSSNTMTGTARSAHRCSAIAHSRSGRSSCWAAFILLFALLRLHAATLTFSILNLLLCALYAGILIFILVSASHEMDVVRSTASQPGLNLANDLSFSLVPSYGMYAIIAGTLFMFVGAIVSVVNRSHARRAAFASPAPANPPAVAYGGMPAQNYGAAPGAGAAYQQPAVPYSAQPQNPAGGTPNTMRPMPLPPQH